ncbi:MAG: RNA pseudouridine synthase, partial [Chitinophagaceae bacterium]|nr:RNA pseudouridine synthase [Chitinophagaceae bacterium]
MNNETLDQKLDSSDELFERFSLQVDKGQEALRIDKFLANRIEGASRNKLQQAMNLGMVQVNGLPVKANYKIKPQDQIVIYSDISPEQTEVTPEKM